MIIALTNGLFALIDTEDAPDVCQYNWFYMRDGNTLYVAREENGKIIKLHKQLTGFKQTDHVDGNGLNNTRRNLREATTQQNSWNRGKFKKSSSSYKGVCWHIRDNCWTARIKVNGKRKNLGNFQSEIEAAVAYNLAAKNYFKEYARLNNV